MKRLIILLLLLACAVSQNRSRISEIIPQDARNQLRLEEPSSITSPINEFNIRNRIYRNLNVELVDLSGNEFGLVEANTRPLSVTDEGWLLAFRRYAGEQQSTGRIASAYSMEGQNWTITDNLNPGIQMGRYPSALGTPDYPYIFWNDVGTCPGSYCSRPYYAFDEFGWDGGSYSEPYDVDLLWNDDKDFWVGSPTFNISDEEYIFNVVFADWTRESDYLFHSEAYDDGFVLFTEEITLMNIDDFVGSDDGGSYKSSATLDINDEGIGYAVVSAYFDGADENPPNSPWANTHTMVMKKTENYGASWFGGQAESPYFFIPDDVFEHMMDAGDFPEVWSDDCSDDELIFEHLFCSYDFDLRVDSEGNPHIIVGVLAGIDDSVYPGIPYNGLYHFWIDHSHIQDPGPTQTSTGWNYSRVMDINEMWMWDNDEGDSYWHMVFPSLAISEESDDVLWVAVSGPDQNDFVVTDDGGTPDDECDDIGFYPTWNEEVFIVKSVDGGESWWCPHNATQTIADCWVNDNGELECSEDAVCPDGITLDQPDEISVHAGSGATNNILPIVFQSPMYCTGSDRQELYAGWVELLEEDHTECGVCPCEFIYGDVNCDGNVDVLDVIALVSHILFGTPLACPEAACSNGIEPLDITCIIWMINLILN